jgi:hypothetical protein
MIPVTDPSSFIAAALAPAIALSGCAILASTSHTKHSSIMDRLRALNAEKRENQENPDTQRTESLERQIAVLYRRAQHTGKSIFLLSFAMACIILSSISIAVMQYIPFTALHSLPKWFFVFGILLVLFSLIEELLEVRLSFRIVRYELGLFNERALREAEKHFRDA